MGELIHIPPGNFPEDYDHGHFAVVGKPRQGKTYYCKWMIKEIKKRLVRNNKYAPDGEVPIYVFVSKTSKGDWVKKEADGENLVPYEHVYTEWDEEITKKIYIDCAETECGLIMFDDFKAGVSFRSEKFAQLFRDMSHVGVQIMAIGHKHTDLPAIVRQTATHAIIIPINDIDALKQMANAYLGGDIRKLKNAMKYIDRNKFQLIKINLDTSQIALHAAPDPKTAGIDTSATGMGARYIHAKNQAGNIDAGNVNNDLSDRNVNVNGGLYTDNSNNYKQNIIQTDSQTIIDNNVTQNNNMVINNRAEHNMQRQTIQYRQDLNDLAKVNRIREYLYRSVLTDQERNTCASELGYSLRTNKVTPYNIFSHGYDVEFMNKFFPNDAYTAKDNVSQMVSNYSAPVIEAVQGGNLLGLGVKHFGHKALTLLKNKTGMFKKKKKINRKERFQRRLILLRNTIIHRNGRENGWVLEEGVKYDIKKALQSVIKEPVDEQKWQIQALDVLRDFFIQDYKNEINLIKDLKAKNIPYL
jgi:hypothetical protein